MSYTPEFVTRVKDPLYIETRNRAEILAEGTKTSDLVKGHKLQDLLKENIFQGTLENAP